MKVKRFFASDMRQAIRMVRDELGADAVILSNRKVDGGVEIVSAVDYDEALFNGSNVESPAKPVSANITQAVHQEPVEQGRADKVDPHTASRDTIPSRPASGKQVSWVEDPAIVSMRKEISQLRSLLENQLAHLAWGDLDRREPLHTGVMRRLSAMELDTALVERVSAPTVHARDAEHAWELATSELAASIPVADQDVLDQGGVVALVGSTGVGKTTSIAKLAARHVLRHGQRHVAMVTTDSYRIGAHEQLITYGRLLGIPVQVASDHKELRSTLDSLADKRLVLIDTAGMSQRDVRLTEQFATLAESGVPIRTLLVTSATVHPSVLSETIRAFSGVPLDGAILTKLDEAASLGGVLSAIIRQQLPLMFVANGQRVPEDIHPARAQDLLRKAIELGANQRLPQETAMAEQFGGLRTHVHV